MSVRYAGWRVQRSAPLFLALTLPLLAVGLSLANHVPKTYESTATVLLEQAAGPTATARPRPGEAAPERLRVIAQKVTAQSRLDEFSQALGSPHTVKVDDLSLNVTAGRERATLLTIEASSAAPEQAKNLAEMIVQAVRADYETDLRARLATGGEDAQAMVESLRGNVDDLAIQLALARKSAARFTPDATRQITDRLRTIDRLENQNGQAAPAVRQDPKRAKLEADLARTLSIFTREHPKVILLMQEIASLPDSTQAGPTDAEDLATERAELSARLSQITTADAELSALRLEHATALRELAQAQRDRDRQKRQAEASFDQQSALLSVVMAPSIPAAPAFPSPLFVKIGVVLFSLLIAAGLCWLRVRFDQIIHRPQDLERHLGITPFATLPRQDLVTA